MAQILFKCSDKEKKAINFVSKEQGLKVSGFVRHLSLVEVQRYLHSKGMSLESF